MPVADFPYLRGNDYPKGVRSTLRDAVSYLFVDRLLASGPQAEPYAAGSWGPATAERMVERYGGWYDPPANGGELCD